MDSLEKRMETYINENNELKKRLEDLEINNNMLLSQLQKVQASLWSDSTMMRSQSNQIMDDSLGMNYGSSIQSSNNNNCFTLFMVLILFFAVLLGISSPSTSSQSFPSKDHINSMTTVATAAAVTAATTTAATGNVLSSVSSSSSANACLAGNSLNDLRFYYYLQLQFSRDFLLHMCAKYTLI